MAPQAQGLVPSERVAVYRIADDDLAVGSTLGGQKVAAIAKATGAIQQVFSVDVGKNLLGTVLWRFYDARSQTRLMQEHSGEFLIHPEHQEHLYGLPGDLSVHETFFVLRTADPDPSAVYISIAVENTGDEQRDLAAYLFADFRGDTDGDVEATYRVKRGRRFSCSGNLATMALGLPYAIGAQTAFPNRQVIAFVASPRPAVLEALVDANEPPMPAKIKIGQAKHFGEALLKGQPQGHRIAITLFRDKISDIIK
jgi:hypothetical protein